ncbi:MAG: TetR/AcrR family transcriptional regulator [Pseudomonadota bacterium]
MARPREFDSEEVLARAMRQFWVKGYGGTSLDDLDRATGLNRGSLYNAFGDKRQLYLAALDHYGRNEIAGGVRILMSGGPATKALAKLFGGVAKAVEAGEGRQGCLLCNAAVERAPHDPEVEARVIANYAPLREAFAALLARDGTPGDRRQNARLVDGLFASYLGLYVMAKAGYSARHLRIAAKQALAMLD